MNKIINAQDALDAIDANVGILYDSPTLVTSLKKMVNKLPPVDAVPVRHGRWMHISPEPEVMLGWMPWYCSECGVGVGKHQSTFCPNCGARMDGKGNGNE